jgi:hypothetical protein
MNEEDYIFSLNYTNTIIPSASSIDFIENKTIWKFGYI